MDQNQVIPETIGNIARLTKRTSEFVIQNILKGMIPFLEIEIELLKPFEILYTEHRATAFPDACRLSVSIYHAEEKFIPEYMLF